ncbi:unnamed protein product, partial [Ixodes hexagonus]
QALAGVCASGLQLVTLLGHTDPRVAALAYFGCALLLLLAALLCFMAVQSSMWVQGVSAAMVFGVSMMVFPAVTVLVVSENVRSGSAWTGGGTFLHLAVFGDLCLSFVPLVPLLQGLFSSPWRLFSPVCNYLLYNLGDLAGRLAGAWVPL